jgi:hypothetical protein
VLFIKRKAGSIILSFLLLPVLCYWGAGLSNPNDQAVMSYSLVNHVIVIDAGHGGYDPGAIVQANMWKKILHWL